MTSSGVENIISSTAILHYFCGVFGYANIASKYSKIELLYRVTFVVIKAAFLVLFVYVRKSSGAVLTRDVDSIVFFVTRDLLTLLDIITFYVHTIRSTTNTSNMLRFWTGMSSLEEDMENSGIKLDSKRLKVVAALGALPEYLSMCICISGFKTIFANGRTQQQFTFKIVVCKYFATIKNQ